MSSDVLTNIFVVLGTIIGEFGDMISSLFDNITNIFFTGGVDGDSLVVTPVGQLTLAAFGIGLIWTGIRWLTRLVKMRG